MGLALRLCRRGAGERGGAAHPRRARRRRGGDERGRIDSFWIPRLGGKIDAIPGHVTLVRIHAAEPGRYEGVCAEFCGLGHAAMPFAVLAHPPEVYAARLREAAR